MQNAECRKIPSGLAEAEEWKAPGTGLEFDFFQLDDAA
jgi:hypothetical protein